MTARVYAELPKKSMLLTIQNAGNQLYGLLNRHVTLCNNMLCSSSLRIRNLSLKLCSNFLNCGETQQYAFHWYERVFPPNLILHRQHQQDALRHGWDGLVAGTDGSVDERAGRMRAGYALDDNPVPFLNFFARVGGPFAKTRAEAASLLKLLQDMRERDDHSVNLLVFVDCLLVLDVLNKWGRANFYPEPKELVHCDVICQLLFELRYSLVPASGGEFVATSN
jgi:hypothetical protein